MSRYVLFTGPMLFIALILVAIGLACVIGGASGMRMGRPKRYRPAKRKAA